MKQLNRVGLMLCVIVGTYFSQARAEKPIPPPAEIIRTTERARLNALVEGDVELAKRLHADDFQLINPLGESYSKEQYIDGIASGRLDYQIWEPVTSIEVRFYGEAAVIRYQSKLKIVVDGEMVPLQRYWHTDSYEKRNGRWQIVWSQATLIQKP